MKTIKHVNVTEKLILAQQSREDIEQKRSIWNQQRIEGEKLKLVHQNELDEKNKTEKNHYEKIQQEIDGFELHGELDYYLQYRDTAISLTDIQDLLRQTRDSLDQECNLIQTRRNINKTIALVGIFFEARKIGSGTMFPYFTADGWRLELRSHVKGKFADGLIGHSSVSADLNIPRDELDERYNWYIYLYAFTMKKKQVSLYLGSYDAIYQIVSQGKPLYGNMAKQYDSSVAKITTTWREQQLAFLGK